MTEGEQSFDIGLSSLDGIIELWSAIGGALREAGYGDAAPEYLRLSKLLEQAHNAALVDGALTERAKWADLREAAATAHELLGPLAEAALTLAQLPFDESEAPEPPAKRAPRADKTQKADRRQRKPVRTIRATKPVNARS